LAELVLHLTGCPPRTAVAAVDAATGGEPASVDDALLIVAKAMCSVRRVDLTHAVDLRDSKRVSAQ
jgi:hypothetical protein